VVDFNAANPTVFTGSSNLAAGGEQANGDSLAMIEDAAVANMFAIEAVALFDHYHFRKVMQTVTATEPPLTLWFPGKPNAPNPWWRAYYDPGRIQMRDRYLFADLPLPAGLAATKNVDWSAVDSASPVAKKPAVNSTPSKGAKKTSAKKSPARKASTRKAPAKKPSAKKSSTKKASAKKTKKTSGKKKTTKSSAKKKSVKKKKTAPQGAAKKKAKKRKSRA